MTDGSAALLGLGVSLLALFMAVILAGASDDAGTLVTVFMVGLWLVWLVRHPTAFRSISLLGSNA